MLRCQLFEKMRGKNSEKPDFGPDFFTLHNSWSPRAPIRPILNIPEEAKLYAENLPAGERDRGANTSRRRGEARHHGCYMGIDMHLMDEHLTKNSVSSH